MADSYINIPWPGWKFVSILGQGSLGAVCEIERENGGCMEHAALKIISIPQSIGEIGALRAAGKDDAYIKKHFAENCEKIKRKYKQIEYLRGFPNIVYCDEISSIPHEDGFGEDIFIRTKLLTPLEQSLPDNIDSQYVIKLGIDICSALTACAKQEIIHGDIKPENIMVSQDGKTFKLRDFGIARTIVTADSSQISTFEYAAPEAYSNRKYNYGADIYSLGLVMYWLLNNKRGPFLSQAELPTQGAKIAAIRKRLAGDVIPPPVHGSAALKNAVLKACTYNPGERYQNAAEMKIALEELLNNQPDFSEGKKKAKENSTGAGPTVKKHAEDNKTGIGTILKAVCKCVWVIFCNFIFLILKYFKVVFWGGILALIAYYVMFYPSIQENKQEKFDTKMEIGLLENGIDSSATKLVAYDKNTGTYILDSSYIPEGLRAKKPSQVGGILVITETSKSGDTYSSFVGGKHVYSELEVIEAYIVTNPDNIETGRGAKAIKTFVADQPDSIAVEVGDYDTRKFFVSKEDIASWVTERWNK